MATKNDIYGLSVLEHGSCVKELLAESSLNTMTKNLAGNHNTTHYESASDFSEKYISKIEASYDVLKNIAIDVEHAEEFLDTLAKTPDNIYDDAKIIFIDPNEIGRVNTSFIETFLDTIPKTITKIVSGELSDPRELKIDKSVLDGIKRQTVNGLYKGSTGKDCFSKISKGMTYDYDNVFVSKLAIPFIKSFSNKRVEIDKEMYNVKNMITKAFHQIDVVMSGLDSVPDMNPEVIDRINVYMASVSAAIAEFCTFVSYLMIRKIDTMVINATNLNEAYDNVKNNGFLRLSMESTGITSPVDVTVSSIDNFIGVLKGYRDKIKFSFITSYKDTKDISELVLDEMIRQYPAEDSVCDGLITIMETLTRDIKTFKEKLYDPYPTPKQFLIELNLRDNLCGRFDTLLEDVKDISKFTSTGDFKTDVVFSALSELDSTIGLCGLIKSAGVQIVDTLKDIQGGIDTGSFNNVEGITDDVLKELSDEIGLFTGNINTLIAEIFKAIDSRYYALDSYIDYIVNKTETIIPEITDDADDVDYEKLSLESCLSDLEKMNDLLLLEKAAIYSREKKKMKYGVFTEAETTASGTGGLPGGSEPSKNTEDSTTGGPKVTEDESKMSNEDKEKNAESSNGSKLSSENMSKLLASLKSSLDEFFSKMIEHFQKFVMSRSKENLKFLNDNKESILGRSFNGVTLTIFPYDKIDERTMITHIGNVVTTVNGFTVDSLKSTSVEDLPNVLFSFLSIPKGKDSTSFIKNYYKCGDGSVDEPAKEKYSGAKLKSLTASMMEFSENYYSNGYKTMVSEINKLKSVTTEKTKSLASVNNPEKSADPAIIRAIAKEVKIFSGAILSAYRNRGAEYFSALKQLVPKNRNKTTPEPTDTPAPTNEEQKSPTADTPAE